MTPYYIMTEVDGTASVKIVRPAKESLMGAHKEIDK